MKQYSLDKQQALELIIDDNTIIIDCRREEELDEVPPITEDCFNIPLDSEFIVNVKEELQDEITEKTKILVYCEHGVRSMKALALLREAGFDAYNLEGGIAAIFEASDC